MTTNLADELQRYASMQRAVSDTVGQENPEEIVGWYNYHENVPYETNLLFKYADVRRPIFADFSVRRAFDIGCGEGRMIRRMQRFFGQVDGADISESMVAHARQRTPGSEIFVSSGLDAGAAADNTYDFAYCTISLQHVCVHDTRDAIIGDIVRILKPDGKMTLQLLFSKHFPYYYPRRMRKIPGWGVQLCTENKQHARWMDNKTGATETNGRCDVVIGTDDLPTVRADLLKKFNSVEFWFHDISIGRTGSPRILPDDHPNSHIADDYWGTHFVFIHCDGPRKA